MQRIKIRTTIKLFFIVMFCLMNVLCLPRTVLAVEMNDLYKAEVPVMARSREQYQQGVVLALQQVLVKVSGNPSVATLPIVEEGLKKASSMVQQYRYRQVTTNDTAQSNTYILQVSFDEQLVKQLLQRAGQGVWNADRPLMLVWLVQDIKGKRSLVNEATPAVSQLLTQAADQRGVSLMFPLLDLQDLQRVSSSTVWNIDETTLRTASQRYGANAIVVVRLQQNSNLLGDRWRGHWTLLWQGEQFDWEIEENNLDQAIKQAINKMTNVLVNRTVVSTSISETNNAVVLTVDNVESAEDYAKVLNYLRGLSSVTDVQVMQVNASQIVYELKLQSNLSSLIRAISLKPLLMPVSQTMMNSDDEFSGLEYQLMQ